MAYSCPRCSKPVQRGLSDVPGGLSVQLIYTAFGSFKCAKCGKIPMKEFPAEVRNKVRVRSAALIVSALLFFVLMVVLRVFLISRNRR